MLNIEDWGLIDYAEAWERQKQIAEKIKNHEQASTLVLCQHPSVITIGRNGTNDNITVDRKFLELMGIKVFEVDRGGDVTLHNPGQIVGYPIFDLNDYKPDLHWFLREIEQCIIDLTASFGIPCERVEGLTGVWASGKRKICAIGLHCSRWITTHGFALNVNNALNEFDYIVPCGLVGKEVTSFAKELGTVIEIDSVERKCIEIFKEKF
ncbi:MAG: lipoate-protein ligase [Ignavibacteria bacterium]|nr:lipoate-protein ligase [Ignavibacteria bacterium]